MTILFVASQFWREYVRVANPAELEIIALRRRLVTPAGRDFRRSRAVHVAGESKHRRGFMKVARNGRPSAEVPPGRRHLLWDQGSEFGKVAERCEVAVLLHGSEVGQAFIDGLLQPSERFRQ